MADPVVWFEVTGNDSKKMQSFYGELFDWKIEDNGGYGMVAAGEGGIGGGVGSFPSAPPHLTFYVQVPDLQAHLDRATSLGAEVVLPPTDLPGVSLAMFKDPEGNVVGLVKG